jgi:hypothetical protein
MNRYCLLVGLVCALGGPFLFEYAWHSLYAMLAGLALIGFGIGLTLDRKR